RDWRSGKSNQHGKNSRPLNEQFERMMLPTLRAGDGDKGGRGDLLMAVRGNASPSGHFKGGLPKGTIPPGRLAFLTLRSWMMGLPPSWLETALSIAPSAPPRATRSCRRSPTTSSEP